VSSHDVDARAARPLPVFVINLERDVERRLHMTAELATLGFAAEFVPAVDGRTLGQADRAVYDANRALRVYGGPMSDAEIGCYLSHFRLYERIVREGIGIALILEDDVAISPDLPAILQDLVALDEPPWLVVRLDSVRGRVRQPPNAEFRGARVAELAAGSGLYRLKTHVLGAGGYLIRRDGAARMLEYGRRIFMPIDHTMDRFWENGILPYVVRPMPVRQRADMESRIGVRRHEKRGKPLVIWLQQRVQRIGDSLRKRAFRLSY
jgi:glycosyl transferase family 25